MFDDSSFIANCINGAVIGIALTWVSRLAVKKERKRRYLEDVEKGMREREQRAPANRLKQATYLPKEFRDHNKHDK